VSTTIGLKLDDETRNRLQRLGEARDRSPHWLMKTAITQFLDREERIEQERLEDEARWQRWVETGTHIDHDEMTAWLDGLAARADEMARQRQDADTGRERKSAEKADDRADDRAEQPHAAIADEPGQWR
jgi:predicted transcriptional regulator